MSTDLARARAEVTASSAGGAPFLFSFGLTLFLTGLLALWLPTQTAALILLFQGNAALPMAFWLQRQMAWGEMSPDNPLRPLSVQLAMSQIAALPMVLLAFGLAPHTTGVALASVAAGHLVPYAWLHRTSIYLWLAPAVSIGALVIALQLKQQALPWTLFYMAGAYAMAGVGLYRHARALWPASIGVGQFSVHPVPPEGSADKRFDPV
ncbi:MAG: hypothetical protein AB7Q16_23495 [Vicinamibacterales bacterium]